MSNPHDPTHSSTINSYFLSTNTVMTVITYMYVYDDVLI